MNKQLATDLYHNSNRSCKKMGGATSLKIDKYELIQFLRRCTHICLAASLQYQHKAYQLFVNKKMQHSHSI